MQGTIQKYVLDMADGKKNAPLRVKQYDTNSRWASISLTAFGEPWPVPAGCRACIAVKKTDGTSVLNDCTVEGSNTVLAPITDQTTAVQGIQQAELYFLAVDGDIKSQTFPINVYPAIMDQRVIESSDEFGTLQTAIIGAREATRTAQDAASEAMVQAGEARDAAEIAIDAASSLDVAVQAAAAAKTSETNAKASETAAAQSKTDVEAMKAAFAGYDKTESGRKYANALTTTAEGDGQVTVTDAWEAPVVNLEVDGASEQVVTTGAQLLDLKAKKGSQVQNGITLTINDNGSVAVNGVATNDTTFILSSNGHIPLEVGKNYAMRGYGTSFDNNFFWQAWVKDPGGVFKDTGLGATFLYTKESEFNFSVLVKPGKTVNATFWPMLNEGSTALPWEPYTGGKPSPSPEYPQEIVSVAHVANSGAQLFDASRIPTKTAGGATVTNNGDGSFTITGSGMATAVFNDTVYYSAEEAAKLFVKPGKYTLSGGISTPYIALTMAENDVLLIDVALPIKDSVSFTVTEDMIEKIKSGAIKVKSGFFSQLDRQLLPGTVKPMLNYDDALPWEPYNGQQRETDLQVAVAGENLFNKEAVYSYNTINRVEIVQLDKGIRIYNTAARTYACAAVKVKLKPNTTYTYSCKIDHLKTKSAVGIRRSLDHGHTFEATMISGLGEITTAKTVSKSFTTDANEYYAVCLFCTYDEDATGDTTFENIQLEEGGTATAWEPYYNPKKVTIPLTEPLRGIGDVKDRFCMRDGVWGIERQFVKIVLNGTESWASYASVGSKSFGVSTYDNIIKKSKNLLCDSLRKDDEVNVWKGKSSNTISVDTTNTDHRLRIYLDETATLQSLKDKFAANPVEVIVERNIPTWEPFPASIQAALNALTTHPVTTYLTVTSTDVAAPVRLTYVQDTRKVIDALQLDVAEQMIELQAQIDQLKVTNNLA